MTWCGKGRLLEAKGRETGRKRWGSENPKCRIISTSANSASEPTQKGNRTQINPQLSFLPVPSSTHSCTLSGDITPTPPPPQRTIVKMFQNHGDKDASHSPHYAQQQASEHRERRSDFSGELLGKGSQHLCVNHRKVPAGSARSWVRTSAPPAPESGSQHTYHSWWLCPHDSNAAPPTWHKSYLSRALFMS